MGGRGSAGRTLVPVQPRGATKTEAPEPPIAAPAAPAPPERPSEPLDRRISQAYAELAAQPGDLVSLARLRDQLADVPREDLDRALLELDRSREIQLDPDPNRKALSERARAAAILLGGEDMHLITIAPPAPVAPAPVTGQMSDKPLAENGWGYAPHLPVSYHDDGPIGTAVKGMGSEARMDVDGEPLANVLGVVATDVNAGRRTAQQALDDVKDIRDRLPAGSAARAQLDWAIGDMDAPPSPAPELPASVPEPLRQLARDLHAVPMVRNDPSREEAALLAIARDFDAGRIGGRRLADAVRRLANQRHESLGECGKQEIDRAVRRAADALRSLPRDQAYRG